MLSSVHERVNSWKASGANPGLVLKLYSQPRAVHTLGRGIIIALRCS